MKLVAKLETMMSNIIFKMGAIFMAAIISGYVMATEFKSTGIWVNLFSILTYVVIDHLFTKLMCGKQTLRFHNTGTATDLLPSSLPSVIHKVQRSTQTVDRHCCVDNCTQMPVTPEVITDKQTIGTATDFHFPLPTPNVPGQQQSSSTQTLPPSETPIAISKQTQAIPESSNKSTQVKTYRQAMIDRTINNGIHASDQYGIQPAERFASGIVLQKLVSDLESRQQRASQDMKKLDEKMGGTMNALDSALGLVKNEGTECSEGNGNTTPSRLRRLKLRFVRLVTCTTCRRE